MYILVPTPGSYKPIYNIQLSDKYTLKGSQHIIDESSKKKVKRLAK